MRPPFWKMAAPREKTDGTPAGSRKSKKKKNTTYLPTAVYPRRCALHSSCTGCERRSAGKQSGDVTALLSGRCAQSVQEECREVERRGQTAVVTLRSEGAVTWLVRALCLSVSAEDAEEDGAADSLSSGILILLSAPYFVTFIFFRTFIFSALTRGRHIPLFIVALAFIFCSYNGFLQSHCMIYVAAYPNDWHMDIRFQLGLAIFLFGMGINIHSDHILRNLRKPSEVSYKIPQGGMFNFVSGANFFGEIVEWYGYYAIATWSLPAFAFAVFTTVSIGPRAYHHHK
ncbi:unnamed protein product [Ranitomeya imitator]|uniref:3-oxo-5-alpha-steroid 4-dehydrogenase C-terminal domain-containing protein n=1 Tax=Ranitomeya imitator TaxID=111125 RepID=A0ABN9L8X9_9NEOB|nr:unnamed protein product [Ranitomeya imitator]